MDQHHPVARGERLLQELPILANVLDFGCPNDIDPHSFEDLFHGSRELLVLGLSINKKELL
jgi:hypothetical protein